MSIADFEEKMSAFTFRQHQDVLTYKATFEAKGFTWGDVERFVRFKKEENVKLEEIARAKNPRLFLQRCPKCGSTVMIRRVSTPKGKANVHGWRSCLECEKCGWERYSLKRPEDVLKEAFQSKKEK